MPQGDGFQDPGKACAARRAFERLSIDALRARSTFLFNDLPDIVFQTVKPGDLKTADGRGKVLTQLVAHHQGEVAELDRALTTWNLRRKTSGSCNKEWLNPQWYCCPDGRAVGCITMKPGKDEYGQSPMTFVWSNMRRQASVVSCYYRRGLAAE